MSKFYKLTCEYIVEVPDETDHEELKLDFSDVLVETVVAHKGYLTGTLSLLKTKE